MRLALIALALLSGAGAQTPTYPGTPVYTFNGPLSCGLRTYSATQVQSWCLMTVSGQMVTVCNHLDTVFPSAPPLTVLAQGFNACQITQPASMDAGTVATTYWVTWMLWQPAATGPVHYQIGYGAWPCLVDANGACAVTDLTTQGGAIQTGTL